MLVFVCLVLRFVRFAFLCDCVNGCVDAFACVLAFLGAMCVCVWLCDVCLFVRLLVYVFHCLLGCLLCLLDCDCWYVSLHVFLVFLFGAVCVFVCLVVCLCVFESSDTLGFCWRVWLVAC